eukprot:CAMPEP_0119304220 /NCGR_PEP_ID=MMETSP1333-20130426/5504_1 /TAXON_ID=418940 /ORGANISM="Scyphosphaera apsteinii, Strain RCC1455" /LENGTH=80 /DNA_ID=CAMNT_0007307071 /DNA_START=803 /DNA_END=1045 /DNA_ORIENTATION=-
MANHRLEVLDLMRRNWDCQFEARLVESREVRQFNEAQVAGHRLHVPLKKRPGSFLMEDKEVCDVCVQTRRDDPSSEKRWK